MAGFGSTFPLRSEVGKRATCFRQFGLRPSNIVVTISFSDYGIYHPMAVTVRFSETLEAEYSNLMFIQ